VFLVMPGTTLDEVVVAANGLDRDVDLSGVEITSKVVDNVGGRSTTVRKTLPATPDSLKSIVVGRYDQVNFRHVFSDLEGGTIALSGEVRYPGNYNFVRGERLSSVL